MAKDDIKSIKMESELKSLVNERIEKSGMEGAEWLESLMALEIIHTIRNSDSAVENDLKDLEKYMNRVYHLLIRVYQRGADAVDEMKEQSMEEVAQASQKVETVRVELSQAQKRLTQKEEELAISNRITSELHEKMQQYEKTAKAAEEINRLTQEKVVQLTKTIEELHKIEADAVAMKSEALDFKRLSDEELAKQKEIEKELRREIEQQHKQNERLLKEAEEAVLRMQKEHDRAYEVVIKEKEIEYKELLLREKIDWQEQMTQMRNQLTEQHANTMAEWVGRMQGMQGIQKD
ncbi:hypothetical protein BVG16_14865 [Paenibacillus selenitireducens]|uniref:Uncharacterized protein n=1 Tax=Paenibacillus selenitireducens TaxID=1324314 RepID=A0A1T2XD14_9BACL|nr:hypothetical protein [Paenibacillus selenitireducens]OPA77718.1 hypothetical protein BVG16_14865 [Paenibacillus selenitireducens]